MNIRFARMSYEQASREGDRIMNEAAKSGNWCWVLDDLFELREIMQRQRGNPPLDPFYTNTKPITP